MITKEEQEFIGRLSNSELDSLIGELCKTRKDNPDVQIMDNIKNNIDPILEEQLSIAKDAFIIEEDIMASLFKSGVPLSQEEMNMLKANNLYDKYANKYLNQENEELSVEEEIKRSLSIDNEEDNYSFPEEEEYNNESIEESVDSYKDMDTNSIEDNTAKTLNGGNTIMNDNRSENTMELGNFVAGLNNGETYVEDSLSDVAKKLDNTIEKITSGEAVIDELKKNETSIVLSENDDDHEMTIEEFNDVPATNLTVDNNILTSVLTETYDNVSIEDAMKLIEVMNRYKSGEKFDVFEALPNSLKAVINAEAASVGANKSTINFFAKTFINDLVNNTYIDKEIKDFNEELKEVLAPMNNIAGTVMDEYSDEVYHKFTDKLEDKANEIEAENPEKAAQLREVSKSFTEAINLKRIKDILKENPSYANKSYKTARDNWNKFCNEYKSKVSKVNPTPRDIDFYLIGLNSSLKSEYSEDIIKALVIMVANSVIKAIEEENLTEHIYAYYASNSMYTIAFTANNSEVNKIILDNTREVLDIINEYMKPLLSRNSKKNRKRNKRK